MRHSRNSIHYATLRAWLITKRSGADLTIRSLAEKVGISHSIIGKIEDGSRKVDLIEFVEYCNALDVDPHEGLNLIIKSLQENKI